MSLQSSRPDITPVPLTLPFGQQVFTHPMPNTQTCRSFWSQPTCTCGQYALMWVMKATAWTDQPGPPLDLIPDNQGIIAILEDAIDGPYRFAHHALNPYVTVGPSTLKGSITVRATHRLSLQGGARSRQLHGSAETMTLAVMLDHPAERLVEVSAEGMRPKRLKKPPPTMADFPSVQVTGFSPAPVVDQPRPQRRAPKQLIVDPEPPPHVDASIPEILAAICRKADVHPELKDWLVIPRNSVSPDEPLRPWVVVRDDVDRIYVHKPRLDQVYPFGEDAG